MKITYFYKLLNVMQMFDTLARFKLKNVLTIGNLPFFSPTQSEWISTCFGSF